MLQRSKFFFILVQYFCFQLFQLKSDSFTCFGRRAQRKDNGIKYHPFILVTNEQSCGESALSSRYPSFQLIKNGLDPTITSAHVHTSFYPVPTR